MTRKAKTCHTNGAIQHGSLLLVALLSVSFTTCATRKPPTPPPPEFASRYAGIKNVAILPPEVELELRSVGGGKEPLTVEAGYAATDLVGLMRSEFAEHGRKAEPLKAGAESTTDPEKLFRDAWIRRSYGRLEQQLGEPKAPALVYSGVTIGEGSEEFARQMGADGLVFVVCRGWRRTKGSIAGELLTKGLVGAGTAGLLMLPQDPIGGVFIGVALVDGKTGDLVWANRSGKSFIGVMSPTFDKATLEPVVKAIFADLPQ